MLIGLREAELLESTNALLDARRTRIPIKVLPYPPTGHDEVRFIQDRLVSSFGEVGGWKVGASNSTAAPTAAPMPAAWIAPSGATIANGRLRGVEAEVAFLLGHDLPARPEPYTDEEVYAAVASCHPAIEILETGLDYPVPHEDNESKVADLQLNGGFIYGPAFPAWRTLDFSKETAVLAIEGVIRYERTDSNPAGNLLRLLPWLANQGAARTGGLRAGQWITTGSWTGAQFAEAGETADIHFTTLGRAGLRFT